MILAVSATEMEMSALTDKLPDHMGWSTFVCGVGPVEAGIQLSSLLARKAKLPDLIINFGIGGGYFVSSEDTSVNILDVCLAKKEVLADFGIELEKRVESLEKNLTGPVSFEFEKQLVEKASSCLTGQFNHVHQGTFLTVNCVSGTKERGEVLKRKWNGICENMEGAAAARASSLFQVPFLEVRVISNMVEDRNLSNWKIKEAVAKSGEVAALIMKGLIK